VLIIDPGDVNFKACEMTFRADCTVCNFPALIAQESVETANLAMD